MSLLLEPEAGSGGGLAGLAAASGPSPHAVSPLLSPVLGGKARRDDAAAAAAATPKPAAAAAATPKPAAGRSRPAAAEAPWQESWTDEVFSADVALPAGFDLAAITGPGAARTERLEVDTGTVITVESEDVGNLSVVICGDDERNVDAARSRIETFVCAVTPGAARRSSAAAATLAVPCKLFEAELQMLLQEEELSERLAQELQHEEEQIELSIRADEQAGAQLAAQLHNQEEADERSRHDSLMLSEAFFDDLPAGYVRCPGCSVAIETLPDNSVGTLGPVQELPRGATLDTAGAEQHKGRYRFRCLQCSTEFCSGCGATPHHYGFDCESWAAHLTAQRCRFCGDVATDDACCGNEECRRFLSFACKTPLACGHLSCGVAGADLPCLEEACSLDSEITATADDWCMICYVSPLRGAPCVLLGCNHVFHAECLKARIVSGRPAARLSFHFLDCPACGVRVDPEKTPYLRDVMEPHIQMENEVKRKATQRLRESSPEFLQLGDKDEDRLAGLAMRRFNYYPCSRCGNVFFGGEAQCGERQDDDSNRAQQDENEEYNADELVCGACSSTGETTCPKHDAEFIEYKCRFCCRRGNVATFFCGGSTHFCSECHKKGWGATAQPCDPATCMFGGKHPEGAVNGKDEYSLGCGLCRNNKDR